MSPGPGDTSTEKKGHICPPSNATHPRDRWESLFVYSFMCKFTNLKGSVDGLESPMDFEGALLSKEPTDIMTAILTRFVRNLRPQTRNTSADQISSTVAAIFSEYMKMSERTVFWDEETKTNKDPFQDMEGGFFAADWDLKLKVLRQLVELQLCHSPEIKGIIDRAWGVVHNKHKKKETPEKPPDPSDPHSQEKLQLVPIGQDITRLRYWVADDSSRVYTSTNPWKITATFQTVCTTREEYMQMLERLKASSPPENKSGERRSKSEQSHVMLVNALESRVEAIDAELARVARKRKKLEQKQLFNVQAEIRQTRLRRTTRRPDYAYIGAALSEDEGDEYVDNGEQDDDEEYDQLDEDVDMKSRSVTPNTSGRRLSVPSDRRRSTRTAVTNGNGKRTAAEEWKGERRSSRLGAPPETQFDEPSLKRARTVDSTTSGNSADAQSSQSGVKVKTSGAAALRTNEVAIDALAGKKKSRFWYYAVEPAPGQEEASAQSAEANCTRANDYQNGARRSGSSVDGLAIDNIDISDRKTMDGSLSPTSGDDY